jgi:hypothetical protein
LRPKLIVHYFIDMNIRTPSLVLDNAQIF